MKVETRNSTQETQYSRGNKLSHGMKLEHRTKRALMDTVSALLDKNCVTTLTSEQVLDLSGVSKGSMYHFFRDFNQLLEESQIERFEFWADEFIAKIKMELEAVQNAIELKRALHKLMLNDSCVGAKVTMLENFRAMSLSTNSENFYKSMCAIQNKIFDNLEGELSKSINRIPNLSEKISASKLALLIEVWLTGKNIGTFHKSPIGKNQWGELTESILNCIFS